MESGAHGLRCAPLPIAGRDEPEPVRPNKAGENPGRSPGASFLETTNLRCVIGRAADNRPALGCLHPAWQGKPVCGSSVASAAACYDALLLVGAESQRSLTAPW